MSYYFSKIVRDSFDEAVAKLTVALKKEGFGILTEIDLKQTLKKKFNMDFRRYKILGACNLPFSYVALPTENITGTMFPCDVIVQETVDGQVKVTAIDPVTSIQAVENPKVKKHAAKIGKKLKTVIDRV
jgi:uncharacterized protein (DUF302 family)